jgi:hypothetical protein
MTAQINDTCFHRKIHFDLAGISGDGLFEPSRVGLKPVAICSACWRGYVAHYSIIGEALFLTRLCVYLSEDDAALARTGKGLEIFGVMPVAQTKRGANFLYRGLRVPILFSGGLLLADEFIPELYIHMGFHPAWKYKNVREVVFDSGMLAQDDDRSSEVAQVRAELIKDNPQSRGMPRQNEIEAWVKKCFSRDYWRGGW